LEIINQSDKKVMSPVKNRRNLYKDSKI